MAGVALGAKTEGRELMMRSDSLMPRRSNRRTSSVMAALDHRRPSHQAPLSHGGTLAAARAQPAKPFVRSRLKMRKVVQKATANSKADGQIALELQTSSRGTDSRPLGANHDVSSAAVEAGERIVSVIGSY